MNIRLKLHELVCKKVVFFSLLLLCLFLLFKLASLSLVVSIFWAFC